MIVVSQNEIPNPKKPTSLEDTSEKQMPKSFTLAAAKRAKQIRLAEPTAE